MYIVANFENSLLLELAITGLEKNGVAREEILALPLLQEVGEQVFDSIHGADGISNVDTAMILGSMAMVLGTIYGFVLTWGPIICGLIGLLLGMILGYLIDRIPKKNKGKQAKGALSKGGNSVILMISCSPSQQEGIEKTLKEYFPLGMGKIGQERGGEG